MNRTATFLACVIAIGLATLGSRPAHAEPRPGDESGRTDEVDPGDSTWRVIGRVALFVPSLAVKLVLAPARGVVWAEDRYQLRDMFYRVFFNADRTIGLYPTASYESFLGLWAGLRFEDLDTFGARERLVLHATTGAMMGDTYGGLAVASLQSGDRFGRVQLALAASFGRRPDDAFYGIGNGDTTTAPAMQIDPRVDETAVDTSYRWQQARAALSADARIVDHVHVIGGSIFDGLRFAPNSSGMPIDVVYDPAGLVGFETGVRQLENALELRFDSRRPTSMWEPPDVHSSGTLASISLGRITRLDDGAGFWRYGVELQRYLRAAKGPRLFSLRFRGDAVSGSRDEVPFLELPTLGGGTFLRGYPLARFRDRVSAVGSVAYEWDLSRFTSAYLFTDVGRVFPSLDAVAARDLRLGYGIGLELHTYSKFALEGSVASSIDGGVFLSLSLNPVLDSQPRWR